MKDKAERNEFKKQNKKVRRVLLVVIIILAAVYATGVAVYSQRFYGRGTIFGVRILNRTAEQVEDMIRKKVADYRVKIKTRDEPETIAADDVSLVYDDSGEIERMLKEQNPFLWFLMPVTAREDRTLDLSFDSEKLLKVIEAFPCMQKESAVSPTDAHLEYDGSQFVIVNETYGNELDHDKTVEAVSDSICKGLGEISLDALGCYVAPGIYADDPKLAEECDQVNRILQASITYDFGDRSEVVDREKIADWITFGEDYSYDISWDKVNAYLYELGRKYDTFGLSRTFQTHDGELITLRGGDYGWCIHKDKSTEALISLIREGAVATTEPVYLYSAVRRETDDIGGTYVEVSIEEQKMWLYKDGECVLETPVVTGCPSLGWDTPAGGVWAVDARISPYTLTGQDYNTEVTYWLPFNGNVGIHDAPWRDKFGGDVYKGSGSHGCVNTPPDAARTIYETMKIGYPVVVY